MIETGKQLNDFMTSLNGGATVELTLSDTLVSTAKAILEEERAWSVLKKIDTSKSITSSSVWTEAIDISTITRFSDFYGDSPVKIFDGNNTIEYFRQVPWEERLLYKDVNGTFTYDHSTENIYINGTVAVGGTLWINYTESTEEIDLEDEASTNIWYPFPNRFIPLLAFYAIGVFKGAIDYDSINRQMLPSNQSILFALKNALDSWDNKKQLNTQQETDPTDIYGGGFRNGSINTNNNY